MKRLLLAILLCTCTTAQAAEPIKIGYLYSYSGLPDEMIRAKNAATIALDEFNAKSESKAEILFRDDKGNGSQAVLAAQELAEKDKVNALAGVSFTTASKAVYELAQHVKIPYFATWCSSDICVKQSDPYVVTFEEPYNVTAYSVAKNDLVHGHKKWAFVIGPDTWHQTLAKDFKEDLKKFDPNAQIVTTISSDYGKANGAAIARTIKNKGADAVFISLTQPDLLEYVRAARSIKVLDGVQYVHPYLPPERLEPFKNEGPSGWVINGYPGAELPQARDFIVKYKKKYNQDPGFIGALSYTSTKMALEAINQSQSRNGKDIVQAALHLKIDGPLGTIAINPNDFRANTHLWSGRLQMKNGHASLSDYKKNAEER